MISTIKSIDESKLTIIIFSKIHLRLRQLLISSDTEVLNGLLHILLTID